MPGSDWVLVAFCGAGEIVNTTVGCGVLGSPQLFWFKGIWTGCLVPMEVL